MHRYTNQNIAFATRESLIPKAVKPRLTFATNQLIIRKVLGSDFLGMDRRRGRSCSFTASSVLERRCVARRFGRLNWGSVELISH